MFFKIAVRNVFRNKRRTALSLAVIVFGVSMLYLVVGFVTDSLASTKQSMAQTFGSIQIADARVFDHTTQGYDHLLGAEAVAKVTALLDGDPRVTGTKEELGFTGLIGNSKGSRLIVGTGFVPGNAVEDFSEYVVQGQGLDDGSNADPNDRFAGREVIMGRRLAAALGVQPGDLINVATTTVDGNFNAASARIMGVFKYNDLEKEGQLAFVTLPFAQKLLRTDGVERIVVDLANIDGAERFADELKGKLAAAGLNLDVRPWQQLNPLYDQVKQFGDAFTLFTNAGVFILVFFGVLEVLTMSFLERTREVGTIRAVGTKRRQVFAMFLQEGLALGVLGSLLGVGLGAGLSLWLNNAGLSWLPPGAIDPVAVHIQVSAAVALLPLAAALISTLLGAIYPAFKSSRLNIVRSLGYV